MSIEFSVANYRSIKGLQTLSFMATGLKSSGEDSLVDENNISIHGYNRLLKTVGIYGANASGKSNFIRALGSFIDVIKNEPSSQSALGTLCDPFLFQDKASDTACYFQIILLIDGKKCRYGFTIRKNTNIVPNDDNKSKEI